MVRRLGSRRLETQTHKKGSPEDGGVSDDISLMEAALKLSTEEVSLLRVDPEAPEFVGAPLST
jgi:hypothetical protein